LPTDYIGGTFNPHARDSRRAFIATSVAFALTLAMDVAYLVALYVQQSFDVARTVFVASYLALMALLLVASVLVRPISVRLVLRVATGAGLLAMGFFAIFSIGVPLIIAGILAFVAVADTALGVPDRAPKLWSTGAALLAVIAVIAGFELAGRIIVCPPHGTMGGGGFDLFTGPYHYECVEGQLTHHSGP
jgi:hypothetical protein